MSKPIRILILEDNPADVELVQFEMKEAGITFTSKVVMTEKYFICELQEFKPDLILSDYDLPTYNGAMALAEARKRCPDTPFILVTGAVSEDRAIEILTQGAKDYVLKNRLEQRLVPAIRRALAEREEHLARKKAEAELREAYRNIEQKVRIRTAELEKEIAYRKTLQTEIRESESQENAHFTHFIERREQAIARMREEEAASISSGDQVDARRLLQELDIYRMELEMMNEELRQSRDETEALLTKYRDVYDFAPVGYFSLNADGKIMQVNLTGAKLLGVERARLIGQQFRFHIPDTSYPSFNAFFKKIFEGDTIEECELMLLQKEGVPSRFVRLEARLSEDRKECYLAMIDLTKHRLSEGERTEFTR